MSIVFSRAAKKSDKSTVASHDDKPHPPSPVESRLVPSKTTVAGENSSVASTRLDYDTYMAHRRPGSIVHTEDSYMKQPGMPSPSIDKVSRSSLDRPIPSSNASLPYTIGSSSIYKQTPSMEIPMSSILCADSIQGDSFTSKLISSAPLVLSSKHISSSFELFPSHKHTPSLKSLPSPKEAPSLKISPSKKLTPSLAHYVHFKSTLETVNSLDFVF